MSSREGVEGTAGKPQALESAICTSVHPVRTKVEVDGKVAGVGQGLSEEKVREIAEGWDLD